MLNKECCIKCRNNYAEEEYYENDWMGWKLEWTEDREKQWKEGEIYCPVVYLEINEWRVRRITEQPPEKCSYYLENII